MAKNDPELRVHKDWLGLLQPVGLVVSPPALVKAQAVPSQNVAELQLKLLSVVDNLPESTSSADDEPSITDWRAFFQDVLGWSLEDIAGAPGGPPIPEGLELVLPDYNETLRPTYAVVDSMGESETLMLVQLLARGTSFDEAVDEGGTGWSASPQAKLERLMREVKVPAGLLCNSDAMRLVYAPSGESSGHVTFPIAAMCEVNGRPILAALHMLLSEHRVFSAPDGRRLLDILSESRKYQAEVSNVLSDQVLGALWELLRGFQSSDPEDGHRIFSQTARADPKHIYGGQLTLLMRLIFVLYAEDGGLMPEGDVYANNYSVSGLYDRLRSDAGRYPDTMDQRYGAYAWLLSLFRLIFDGGGHGGLRLPTRHGQLFDPDEFPFLEGRPQGVMRVVGEKFEAPRVSDGCIYRVLEALLILDGERLSYRALDVEQVGSVYEAMMGYEVERASGRCIAVRPKHIVVDVDALLEVDGAKRNKWLKDQADSDLTGASATALKAATTADEVVAALGRRVSPRSLDVSGTPRLMAPGSLYLQPGEERRRTGSHYTPRELTEPIVRTTLRPVIEALGKRPTPEQILDLKVCDPAMGSGAFLVETCRQLAERLVTAWEVHDSIPQMPPDEEPLLHARRLVAQRCLYGVDKNPFAVSLAKLSLWLVTLARDHAFTFIDHALKQGDSLVGLTRKQIAAFHWEPKVSKQVNWVEKQVRHDIEKALGWRNMLQELDGGDYKQKKEAWWKAENALVDARLIGDLVVAAFFGAEKDKGREELRNRNRNKVEAWRTEAANRPALEDIVQELRSRENPVPPLHWEIEFPEVFGRENPGFDAIVGNPPFIAGMRISTRLSRSYLDYLYMSAPNSGGRSDLVAYFFRRAFGLLGASKCLGLLATNTIAQGDTRVSGLYALVQQGGQIYTARKRIPWPGAAAVVVSCVHICRGQSPLEIHLDGKPVEQISCYLLESGGNESPKPLVANKGKCFSGVYPYGAGFLFQDGKADSEPLDSMRQIVRVSPKSEALIRPYIGGQEFLNDPHQRHCRYVIDFGEMTERQAREWPDLMAVLEQRVRPFRTRLKRAPYREKWWLFAEPQWALREAIEPLSRMLMHPFTASHLAFAFVPASVIVGQPHLVFVDESFSAFCCLQNRVNEIWVRFTSSTLKDDLSYKVTDSFETFAFPENWQSDPTLEAAGKTYYEFRADLMVRNDEGLTKTYNRFHDPNNHEPDIVKLRELHAAMDRAVLDAYVKTEAWPEIPTDCEFLLDYEIDEETWGTKKKPYRYRWPEAVHDKVLARLLNLNRKRYTKEVAAGLHDKKGGKKAAPKKRTATKSTRPPPDANLPLFGNR